MYYSPKAATKLCRFWVAPKTETNTFVPRALYFFLCSAVRGVPVEGSSDVRTLRHQIISFGAEPEKQRRPFLVIVELVGTARGSLMFFELERRLKRQFRA